MHPSPLFEGVDPLPAFADSKNSWPLKAGEVLVEEGQDGDFFAIVDSGAFQVCQSDGEIIGTAGAGSILGELGVASGHKRRATVTATSDAAVLVGTRQDFDDMLHDPLIGPRVRDIAANRLAHSSRPVHVTLADGQDAILRPLLHEDRGAVSERLKQWSTDALRRRFFTGAEPSELLIDFLVSVDYVNHFAWALGTEEGNGIAVVRFIRANADPTVAEIAFGVDEGRRGQGIGTLLLGAIASAAEAAGIRTLTAEMLSDNEAMKHVLAKAHPELDSAELGTVNARLSVSEARAVIEPDLAVELLAAASDIVTAAGIAVIVPPGALKP